MTEDPVPTEAPPRQVHIVAYTVNDEQSTGTRVKVYQDLNNATDHVEELERRDDVVSINRYSPSFPVDLEDAKGRAERVVGGGTRPVRKVTQIIAPFSRRLFSSRIDPVAIPWF